MSGQTTDRVARSGAWYALVASVACLATASHVGGQGVDTTITIRAFSSTLEFVPARISVKSGTRLRLRFSNEGTYPHNFVLPKREDDIDELAAAAAQAGESGFIPAVMRSKLIAYTRLVGPGETGEVTFVVPAPGTYTFVCLFPGHAATMLGTLRALR